MKTVLVTGASGFIGKHVTRLLLNPENRKRYRLVLLTSSKKKIPGATSITHQSYCFSKSSFLRKGIKTVDIILHAGAFTPKNQLEANDITKCNSNITNTEFLLKNIPGKAEKIIFLSTVDVYDSRINRITESSPVFPISLYGWSKIYCERLIERWGIEKNVAVQILRIGHIYGSGEEHYQKLIPATIKSVMNNERPVLINGGKQRRSFLHISDCAKAIVKSIELKGGGDIINITSSKSHKVCDIINTIIELSRKDLTPVIAKKPNMPNRNFLFRNDKMQRTLTKESVSIQEGLREEIRAYRK